MPNVKFVHQFLEQAAITFSVGADPGYPVINLQDRNPRHVAKSATNAINQRWIFQFPTALAVDTLMIDGHNFYSSNAGGTGILLQSSPDGAAWTTKAMLAPAADLLPYEMEIGQHSDLYWCLYFTKAAGNLAAIPQCGNISIGARAEFGYPPDTQRTEDNEHNATVHARAMDSTPWRTENYGGIATWLLGWTNGSDPVVRTPFEVTWSSVDGDNQAFYFIDQDGSIQLVLFQKGTNPKQTKAYLISDILNVGLEAFFSD